jgi:hypothetical protein
MRQRQATKHRQFVRQFQRNVNVDHVQTSVPVVIPGSSKTRKLRHHALQLREADGWTDDFFMAVVILCNIRARTFLCHQDKVTIASP